MLALFVSFALGVQTAQDSAQKTIPPTSSQTAPLTAPRAHRQKIGDLLNALNLTDDQKAQLKSIQLKHWDQRRDKHKAMMGVLSKDQRRQLKTLRQQQKSRP